MFKYFLLFADPLFDEEEYNMERERDSLPLVTSGVSLDVSKGELLNRLQMLRGQTLERLQELEKRVEQ
jgi:hypothetical protein